MDVISLQVFVSLVLVVGSLVLFLVSAGRGDFEHSDRLALLPIERETASKHQPVADITATTKRPK
jgi:hypothetical protein